MEAVIQARLYAACKKVGLACDLQYVAWSIKETSVFDLVVIVGNEIVAIVEVKDAGASPTSVECSSQIKRYRSHSVPVFILYSIHDIPYLVKQLLEVREKFFESIDPVKAECLEADRQYEAKWNTKIATAFSKFDETFPGYKFTGDSSLEVLAIGVRTLGLIDTLKLMDEFDSDSTEFISALKRRLKRDKDAELQPSRYSQGRWGVFSRDVQDTVSGTITAHQNRQNRIDEKLS